jgi:quinoprotein dehydrogenase-associated probable ABC transporter substrate-binding protein
LAAIIAVVSGVALAAGAPALAAAPHELRVCADPDNLPFSDKAGRGFENRLAEFVAERLGDKLSYAWWPWQRGRLRQALAAGLCDVVIGVPSEVGGIAVTRPYYWSSYVFVSRADRHLDIASTKDDRLRRLRIGVEEIHGNRFYTPPARVLADAGLADRLAAYPIEGAGAAPRARIIDDVARGAIDIAAVWGPVGGYFAQRAPAPLSVVSIADYEMYSARKQHFGLAAFQFDIAMGVRPDEAALRRRLDRLIARDEPQITRLLQHFGIPLVVLTRVASETGQSADPAQ